MDQGFRKREQEFHGSQFDRLVDTIVQAVEKRLQIPQAVSEPQSSEKPVGTLKDMVEKGAQRVSATLGADNSHQALAQYIDHTLLKPEATKDQLKKLCEEAKTYSFATVCVNPSNIEYCAQLLKGSTVKPIAVVGFPLGATSKEAKAFEASQAVKKGAEEIDMVINIGALKSKDYCTVLEDIEAVVSASYPKPVKVIIESGGLTHDEKVIACSLSKVGKAAFVKTSTGFGPGGATVEDIELMRTIVGPQMGVKASGGVRDYETAKEMIDAGANRIGASASVAIVTAPIQNPSPKRYRHDEKPKKGNSDRY